ncbi:hypothetical protein, partial [Lysinibacillus sp. NPDC093688]|uniref:hypothetical protein n=1 Tax=Lysinibacillus sp. NPDC093688 TaxID=3390577 RepID=UPI003D025C6A
QQQMFYLCESEASATNVLSVRKRSVSNKAPSRNGNQPHVLMMILLSRNMDVFGKITLTGRVMFANITLTDRAIKNK